MKKCYLILIVFSLIFMGCESAHRATQQRRGLMMPKLSEMPVNKKHYKDRISHNNYKKVKKIQKQKKRK